MGLLATGWLWPRLEMQQVRLRSCSIVADKSRQANGLGGDTPLANQFRLRVTLEALDIRASACLIDGSEASQGDREKRMAAADWSSLAAR